MDLNQLEQLGDELRSVGHQRRRLVERIVQEVNERDAQSSKELYRKLSNISNQAIEIIDRQKQIIDEEVQKM
ncbi:hypothetical protein BACCIP111895_01030 [Neobacillus rhizosphaerae]|uniref:Uncharacterized protein n=1 Tax=Neobacillus rhizosphaerae TaxID=2880965 RepID=A0ABM9EMQ0_9BACI|nr:hypothetical protein [Neobacillus rhizosphaerae]CAH2713876.1 hypothetical protein BACCIP111895_01030 [Neobacillus rhizosphaerae]